MLDFTKLELSSYSKGMSDHTEPLQLPVSALDIDRSSSGFDMSLPMADPCESCGAFNMTVGDYVCARTCFHCFTDAIERGAHPA